MKFLEFQAAPMDGSTMAGGAGAAAATGDAEVAEGAESAERAGRAGSADRATPTDTIVFLHGGNVAGWMWGEQVPAFTDHHILIPDLPGFGASNDLPWKSTVDTADAVAALIRERAQGAPAAPAPAHGDHPHGASKRAHAARAHVVGLSLGSSVAIELALRHPDVTASLFLASATVTRPPLPLRAIAAVMLAFWPHRWFWNGLARGYGLPADSVDLFVETGLGIRQSTAKAVAAEVSRGIPADRLARIAVPTITIAGSKDSASVARDSLLRIRDAVPGALAATAPGAHHQWNIENVDLFNRALRTWLESRTVAAGLDEPENSTR